MSRILSLETSTPICSAAIHESGKLLAVSELHEDQSHGARLAVLVDNLVKGAGLQLGSFDAIAVCSGPGSYTGLRIGTSTAKGLCYSLGLPLLAVNSLSGMAHRVAQLGVSDGLLCPMLDARRMEVYCAFFKTDLTVKEEIRPAILDHDSFAELLNESKITFFGNAVEKAKSVIVHPNARFIDGIYPSAAQLGSLAWNNFTAGIFEDLVHFEPLYLKEFLVKKSQKSML